MSESEFSARRKKDFVTTAAVFIFIMIVICELLLVIWLPVHLRSAHMWEKESAFQEMVSLEDFLRANFASLGRRKKGSDEGEVTLVRICLDEIARYMRLYGGAMNRDQVRDVYNVLKGFNMVFDRMKREGLFYSSEEKLDIEAFLMKLAAENGITIEKNVEEKKTENESEKAQ